MEFTVRHELAAPAEVAFDLLADLRQQPQWSSTPIEGELLTGEPIGAGSRFLALQGGRRYEATITTYRRPELLRIEVLGAHLTVKGEFTFTAAGPGALLEGVLDIGAKGAMRLVLPSFRGAIAGGLPKEAASFARFCEARAAV
jgi:hypothetical protein